jgi:membrane protein
MIIIFLLLFALGAFVFSRLLSSVWERILDYVLLAVLSFLLVMLLNVYICPYKVHFKRFLWGASITLVAWALAVFGFSVYIKISNVGRLYGALSAVIIFLLWLYVLMICFIVGVIINSEKITAEKRAERKRKRNSV